jgi:hypothetical protein
MVFHPKEVNLACRRRTAGTPGHGIAIDQVSKYKYLGVTRRRIMAGTRAKALAKMQAAYGY